MRSSADGKWPIGSAALSTIEPNQPASAAATPERGGTAIGVVGGGQLAWMLADAAAGLGIGVHVQTPGAADPAVRNAASVVRAELADGAATAELARRCQAITFENEWLDLQALQPLAASGVRFLPTLASLAPLLCKRSQRQLLDRLRLPVPRWCELPAPGDLPEDGLAFPLMAKAASGGYDGKGTAVLRAPAELSALLQRVSGADWFLEELVAFEQELAISVARDGSGRVEVWPLARTHQHRQVCDWVLAPAAVPHAVQAFARNIACSLVTALDYVGVLTIEFFYGPGGLQVNEVAPRTHNSAHLTIEASRTSQFAQQARIVAGWPLASTELLVPGALMVNLLGFDPEQAEHEAQRQALARLPGAHLHWYGKQGPGYGRKLGHITLVLEGRTPQEREREAARLLATVRDIWPLPAETP